MSIILKICLLEAFAYLQYFLFLLFHRLIFFLKFNQVTGFKSIGKIILFTAAFFYCNVKLTYGRGELGAWYMARIKKNAGGCRISILEKKFNPINPIRCLGKKSVVKILQLLLKKAPSCSNFPKKVLLTSPHAPG